jgi:hypothetical protein
MDIKVYKKEEVKQPDGSEYVFMPNIIDLIPDITETEDGEIINGCTLIEDPKEELEQQCALATIWQKGLDPLDLESGIRWSQAILEEINSLQLVQDIIDAVADVTTTVVVSFDVVEDDNGQQYLTYKLTEVA